MNCLGMPAWAVRLSGRQWLMGLLGKGEDTAQAQGGGCGRSCRLAAWASEAQALLPQLQGQRRGGAQAPHPRATCAAPKGPYPPLPPVQPPELLRLAPPPLPEALQCCSRASKTVPPFPARPPHGHRLQVALLNSSDHFCQIPPPAPQHPARPPDTRSHWQSTYCVQAQERHCSAISSKTNSCAPGSSQPR